MICETPITKGPQKGKPATGTHAGYQRHYMAGEGACPACLKANTEYTLARRGGPQPKTVGRPAPTGVGRFRITGPQPVRCRGCGTRGVANAALVGKARVIESCSNCREVA